MKKGIPFLLLIILVFSTCSKEPEQQVTNDALIVTLNRGDTIQLKVDANPPGTVFMFTEGTYIKQSIIPKDSNVFDGNNVAVLDGASFTPRAFGGKAKNVTLKNLTIQYYNSPLQHAAVDAEFGDAWIIKDNIIQFNNSVGVNFGNNSQVTGNMLINNGESGFGGGGHGWLMENNQINNNNTKHTDWGFEAGGGKVTEATDGTFRGNTAVGNDGPGIWLDGAANNILIENNTCNSNNGPGIMVEISKNAIVRNNVCKNNGVAKSWTNPQILISSSRDNKIYGNTIDAPNNRFGIFIMSQGREFDATNNEVYENTVWLRGTQTGINGVDADDGFDVFSTNFFHNNTYHVARELTRYFSWDNDYTLTDAQSHGYESESTLDTNAK